jgi:hypothetical protein
MKKGPCGGRLLVSANADPDAAAEAPSQQLLGGAWPATEQTKLRAPKRQRTRAPRTPSPRC